MKKKSIASHTVAPRMNGSKAGPAKKAGPQIPKLRDFLKSETVGIFGVPTGFSEAKIIYIPVRWDVTTSYGKGTSWGPRAIEDASVQVDLFDIETQREYSSGYHIIAPPAWISKLNTTLGKLSRKPSTKKIQNQINQGSADLNAWVKSVADLVQDQGKIPVVIGGDHSTPFGLIQSLAERFPNEIGILHIDAHADLRFAYQGYEHSHASIMNNVVHKIPIQKLVQVGIRDFCLEENKLIESSPDLIATFFDRDLKTQLQSGKPWLKIRDEIWSKLPKKVYISFDVDGLDPSFCPHTGTPVPGGLSWDQAISLIRGLGAAGKEVVGFDLNEVAPAKPGATLSGSEWDANVGARLLFQMTAEVLSMFQPELI